MVEKKKIGSLIITFTVLFIALFCVFDFVFTRWVIFDKPFANQNKIKRLIENNKPNEIPVFGSSKARCSFFPDSLSSNVYNYGMEKCNFDIVELLLEIELDKKKTTPIILEFNHRWFLHKPEHTINISSFIPNIHHPKVEAFIRKYNKYEYYYKIPGLRYYGQYLSYLRMSMKESTGSNKLIHKGGIFSNKTPSKEIFDGYINSRKNAIAIRKELLEKSKDPKQITSLAEKQKLRYLNSTLLFQNDTSRIKVFENLVQQHPERTFIMAFTPYHYTELEGIENYEDIELLFERWRKKFPNIKAFNYSKKVLADDHFKNTSHINRKGAFKFSGWLRKDIKAYLD